MADVKCATNWRGSLLANTLRPDHLRIEQQMLFRKEWHKLTKPERAAMLAGMSYRHAGSVLYGVIDKSYQALRLCSREHCFVRLYTYSRDC
jgi:hypothetical protein